MAVYSKIKESISNLKTESISENRKETLNDFFRDPLATAPRRRMPTCSIVGIEFDTDKWSDIQKAKPKLLCFEYPKK